MNEISEYSQLVQQTHINKAGTLFGGYMLAWLDLAAAKAAGEFLEDTDAWGALTRALDKVEFKEPVFLGDWVKCKSKIIKVGNSSMVIQVKAAAESKDHGKRLACTADITFVAVIKDEEGNLVKFNHNLSLDKE
ncbi:MAG: acyl-CoA thioesterase [Candidatus Neomarinimicrobiota bacterium]|nr:acyl-CoA thioesterase [Candidatus Neomarinimicrobiota bacterium]